MRIIVRRRQTPDDIQSVVMSSAELDLLGKPLSRRGDVSVVLTLSPLRDMGGDDLAFDTTAASFLNRGTGTVVVLIPGHGTAQPAVDGAPPSAAGRRGDGDQIFLSDLPETLREIGARLLAKVRDRWPGTLVPTPAGRFVESPDNFWTVKIQPRDRSLRITVRGDVDRFLPRPELGLKADRPGYSTFKVSSVEDVAVALQILDRARRR